MQTAEITDPFLKEMLNSVSKQSVVHGHSLEYLEGVLEWLLTFTRAKLTEKEQVQFLAKLSKYPKWKLLKLDEFNGSLSQVFAYLDLLSKPEADPVKALPEPKQTHKEKQIAADFSEHIKRVLNFNSSREERIRWEMHSFMELDKKYPQLGIWAQVKNEKRFIEITEPVHDFKTAAAGG